LAPVSRNSELSVSASDGAQTNSDARQTTEFGTFDKAISAVAVLPGQGTASASAEQLSSIDIGRGTFSASGVAATAESETGAFLFLPAASSNEFTYRFSVTGADERVRFHGAIARSETGVVNASLRDLADPPGEFLLQRHLSEFPPYPGEPGPTWNEQFVLLSGHTYEVGFNAWSEGSAGMTSFSGEFNIVNGDFNADGATDAADYVVWRKGLGTSFTQEDFNVWRANFGQTMGGGSGAAAGGTVPEPASLALAAAALLLPLRRR
jgi:hypothetical protein